MFCPRCGYEQKCACGGPVCQNKDGQIHIGNGVMKCFKCGLTKHIDWWTDLELECFKDKMKEMSSGEGEKGKG